MIIILFFFFRVIKQQNDGEENLMLGIFSQKKKKNVMQDSCKYKTEEYFSDPNLHSYTQRLPLSPLWISSNSKRRCVFVAWLIIVGREFLRRPLS